MDPININLATKEQLKTLPGCGNAIASEIIEKQKIHVLTEDDIKSLTKLSAKYWQLWLDGRVTFEIPDGSTLPIGENDTSASGSDTQNQSLDKTQEVQGGAGAQSEDVNKGLRQSPIKSRRGSPTGSIHSRYSRTSHVSSVSSTSRRQYEYRIRMLEEALEEKNQKKNPELIDERNSQKQQIADLMAQLNEQDKKWTERARRYEQQIAAMEEHQKQQAETHRMEMEQLIVKAEESSQKGRTGQGQPLRQEMTASIGYNLEVKGEPQWPMDLRDEPRKEVHRRIAKQQEMDCRKQGLEHRRTFQNQLAQREVVNAPAQLEPKDQKEIHGSPEDSEGGTETPSQDSEEESKEESEDTHDRLQRKIQEKAPGSRYQQEGDKVKTDRTQKEPATTKEIIMARFLKDRDDEQSLPYGPDHWSTDAETPPRREAGKQQDTKHSSQNGHTHKHTHHHHHRGAGLQQDRQFHPEWQDPPKPTRVTTAPRYNHQGWKNIPPQGNRTRNEDRQSTIASSYSSEPRQGGYHHYHRHQRDNHWNHRNHHGHQGDRHQGCRFQGYHDYRQRDHSEDESHQGRGFHRGYDRPRDWDFGDRGFQRKNPKLSNYDGKISFRAYEVKLNRMTQQYQWTEDEKLSKFVEALQDKALQFYGNLPEEVRDDYGLVSKKFRVRFWPQEPSQTVRSQLKVLKQQSEETLEEFAEKCQQLATDAWGATNPEMTEQSALDAFLHGLLDTEAAYSTLDKEPATLDEALEFTKHAMHNRKALLGNCGKAVRTVSFAEGDSMEEKQIRVVRTDGTQNPAEERISRIEESIAETKGQIDQILKLLQNQNGNQGQSRSYANSPRKQGTPIRCYRCQELGHGFRECKSPRSRSPSPAPQKVEKPPEKKNLNE